MTQQSEHPAPQVEIVRVDALVPYEGNPRLIPETAIAAVADSIERFGFLQPIVVDDDMSIAAGHTRLLAAQRLGLTEVPVIRAGHLTSEQVRAYRLSDNRTGEYSGWNLDYLAYEVIALGDEPLPAFDDDELAVLRNLAAHIGDPPPLVMPAEQVPPTDDVEPQPLGDWVRTTIFVPRQHRAELRRKFKALVNEVAQ